MHIYIWKLIIQGRKREQDTTACKQAGRRFLHPQLPWGFLCPEQRSGASWPPPVWVEGPWDWPPVWWGSPSGRSEACILPAAAPQGHLHTQEWSPITSNRKPKKHLHVNLDNCKVIPLLLFTNRSSNSTFTWYTNTKVNLLTHIPVRIMNKWNIILLTSASEKGSEPLSCVTFQQCHKRG